ncbi:DUF3329 domain-containing protein [Pseudomonas sp. G5(2012)]|uniref:DUF3329 domain-containing protein n=1 Tax=Pseudomonas sp. G5(2012) TaxID=1268068 RepID=UPI0005B4D014|nr:DUF3329 domain-containing protein [Pseudomonas sp. G5(2012)]
MNIAQRIFALCAVAALIGWMATGWGILLFLALMVGLCGSIVALGVSVAAAEGETTKSPDAPELATIAPGARVLPEDVMVPSTTEENVRPSVGRRLFLDDDYDV